MPPPRRRRPVQPATRVRIPRTARSRSTPADEPAGETLTQDEPGGETLTQDAPATGELTTEDEQTAEGPTQDKQAGDEPTAAEQAAEEATQDKQAEDEHGEDKQAEDRQAEDEQAADKQAEDEQAAVKQAEDEQAEDEQVPAAGQKAAPGPSRHPLLLPAGLGALAVVLGGLAVWFGLEASSATSGVNTSNTALTDPVATRQVTQQLTSAVNKIFSYNYADTAKTSQAAATLLTGKARQQYDTLFKLVRQDAPKEKLVLTTTVTNSGVEFLDGSRARLLIFADQHDTAGTAHKTTDAGAMFAVNAVNQGGRWKISSIDTFGAAG
jgi:Mce-associated membrane protein